MIQGNFHGAIVSLIIALILGIIPWEHSAITGNFPLERILFSEGMFPGEIKDKLKGLSAGFICGIILGTTVRTAAVSDLFFVIMLFIIVISGIIVPWRHPEKIFFPAMVSGYILFLAPGECLVILPVVLTFSLTLGPLISLSIILFVSIVLLMILKKGYSLPLTITLCFLILFGSIALDRSLIAAEIKAARNSLEEHLIRRKIYRYFGLVFPLVIYPVYGLQVLRIVLFSMAAAALLLEGGRKVLPGINIILRKIFSPVGKGEEAFHISGTTYYLAGSALACLFPGETGPLSLIMLTLGDAWAVLTGNRWGQHSWISGKTVEGSLGCLFICILAGLSFSLFTGGNDISPFSVVIGAIAATLTEALFRGSLDNLMIAPSTAAVIYICNTFIF